MNIEWSSKTPAIDAPGLRLSIMATGQDNKKPNIAAHCVAAFPGNEEVLENLIRSLFLTVTQENGTALYHHALFMHQVIFPDDIKTQPIKEGVIVRLIAFNFNLQEEMGINLVTGRIYIQLTAGMFQSSVASIEVP